jgi:mRNA interferase MazF
MYLRGDVITVSAKSNEGKPRPAIIIQANWLNEKSPPSYIVCLLTSDIYPELDFRPIIEPDSINGLSKRSQVMTDKVQVVRENQIGNKVGILAKKVIQDVDDNLRLLMHL